MRKVVIFLLCCLLLATGVTAANQASSVDAQASVSADGSCQISLTASIRVETAVKDLVFPLPADAKEVTVNGGSAHPRKSGAGLAVDLMPYTGGIPGSYTLTFHYTLPSVVTHEEDACRVEVPLLSGFVMPIEAMTFSVTLPGAPEARPSFTSGYLQDSIENAMTVSLDGAQITGTMKEALLDRETLMMTLDAPLEMFPTPDAPAGSSPLFLYGAAACALVALLYWLAFLRCPPLRRIPVTAPPQGLSAGEIGARLVGAGADLTLMVITWAQLGYLYLDRDDSGRIFLRKRMPMGNERSAFENRCFRSLFGRKNYVDGTGYHYARLCRQVAGDRKILKGQYRPGSGNPQIFRALACGMGLFAGGAMGWSLGWTVVWQGILAVTLGVLGAVGAWLIQAGCCCFHLREKKSGIRGGICLALFLIAGAVSGKIGFGAFVGLTEILAGLAAAYGGRRTPAARQTAGEILGLRHYMKRISPEELRQIQRNNPEYYYALAPYALALGVDLQFARHLGRVRLPRCMYLVSAVDAQTAWAWYPLLREAADTLDARQKKLRKKAF